MFALLGIALFVDGVDGPAGARDSTSPSACRAGRATCSTWWSISPPTCSCRPTRSWRAAAAGRLAIRAWPRRSSSRGALYFADRNMKTEDNYFRGFPAVWNVVAFYLLLLRPTPLVCGRHNPGVRGADSSSRLGSCIRSRGQAVAPSDDCLARAVVGACGSRARTTIWARSSGSRRRSASSRLYFLGAGLLPDRRPQ